MRSIIYGSGSTSNLFAILIYWWRARGGGGNETTEKHGDSSLEKLNDVADAIQVEEIFKVPRSESEGWQGVSSGHSKALLG